MVILFFFFKSGCSHLSRLDHLCGSQVSWTLGYPGRWLASLIGFSLGSFPGALPSTTTKEVGGFLLPAFRSFFSEQCQLA